MLDVRKDAARPHADMQLSRVFPSMNIRYKNDCEAGVMRSSNQDDDRNQEQPNADVTLEKGLNDNDGVDGETLDGVDGDTLDSGDSDHVKVMKNNECIFKRG